MNKQHETRPFQQETHDLTLVLEDRLVPDKMLAADHRRGEKTT